MATDPNDLFAEFRTGAAPTAASAPDSPTNPDGTVRAQPQQDIFNEFRVSQQAPDIRRENNTLGEEFRAGLGGGIDSMQASLFGVAGLAGRELGIGWLEDAGMKGAAEQFEQAHDATRQSQGFTDIESAGGFFRWASASLGEAIPSLAAAMTGGGIGAVAGKKAVELGVKKSVARRVERDLRGRMGFSTAEALESTRSLMTTKQGQDMVRDAFLRGKRVIDPALAKASKVGSAAGAVAVSALPQIGGIDQELINSGVADPGLTALLGGIAGGALEALPALRLLDKMFPGVDKQVSKQFVKDFAVSTGTQLALEGSTEAAQEIIQLAALAYKDPTFDMFSPDAKRRVVDAFAAGALVGAVTGGGAEGIGAIQSGAFSGAKKAVPVIGAWSMTAKDAASTAVDKAKEGLDRAGQVVEEQLPEGFVEADNTLFQEIKGRVYSTVQPHVEAAVNSLQQQVDKISQNLNDNLEGGVNAETASISQVAKAAHEKFLQEHGDQIQKAKDYMDTQAQRIAAAAKEIKDPEQRAKYIQDQVDGVKERLAGFVDMIRRKAAERDQKTEAEVDNMDIDDDMLAALNIDTQADRDANQQAVDDLYAPQSDKDANTGQVDPEPIMTFGKFQLTPEGDVSGKETVQGYDTLAQAKLGRATLRRRFRQEIPFSTEGKTQDDSFKIVKNTQGPGWVIQVINKDVQDTQKFFNDLKAVERDATAYQDNERAVRIDGLEDPESFGFQKSKKGFDLDVQSMAYRGKNLDDTATTDMEGFLAFAGEMMQRGMINNEQFAQLQERATKIFNQDSQQALKAQSQISDEIQKTEAALKIPQDDASTQRNQARLAQLKKQQTARKSFDERATDARAQEAKATQEGGFAPPINYPSRGEAWRALIEFKEEMDLAGVPYPFSDKEMGWSGQQEVETKAGKKAMVPSKGSKILNVERNKDGTWRWGLNRTKKGAPIVKAFMAKNPDVFSAVQDAMHNRRRSEALDKGNRESGDFSVNLIGTEGGRKTSSGNLGDRTGATAGSPDVNAPNTMTSPVGEAPEAAIQRDFGDTASNAENVAAAEAKRNADLAGLQAKRKELVAKRDTIPESTATNDQAERDMNALDAQIQVIDDTTASILGERAPGQDPNNFGNPETRQARYTTRILEETDESRQATDRATDPKNLEPEFEADRKAEMEGETKGKNTFTSARAKKQGMEQTAQDNRLLKRWGRPSSVKILLGGKVGKGTQVALTKLANFVTKTLGLSNQIVVLDNAGLALLMEQSNDPIFRKPIFEQTLNDPNVKARNIRINDTSFVYISPEVLSDPVLTILAFGHEMGHHVYRVAWDKMTPEGQQKLKDAYVKAVGVAQAFPGVSTTQAQPSAKAKAEIKVLKAELAEAKAALRTAENAAFNRNENTQEEQDELGAQIARLENDISNKTPLRITGRSTSDEAFNEAGFNEWMADQLAAWIIKPRLGEGSAQSFFAKVGAQIRKLYDFMKKTSRFELNETFEQFANAIAMKAAAPQDAAANPYNDAQIKAWFRDQGVTMYGWFGDTLEGKNSKPKKGAKTTPRNPEVDNITFDFVPATQESRDALARMEAKYPVMAKRAIAIRNWMSNARKMVWAPSTSVMRDLNKRGIKSANKLVKMFNRQEAGTAKEKQNYHQAVELMRGQFVTQYTKVRNTVEAQIKQERPGIKNKELQTLTNAKMREIGKSLSKKDGDPSAKFTKEEAAVRAVFDAMHEYAEKAGLPVRKVTNYFPRQNDRQLLIDNKQKILDHLTLNGLSLEKARHLYNSLIDPNANDGRATIDAVETPGFTAMNSRHAQDKWFDQFLDHNTDMIVANYVNQVVKRAEFNRRLGEAMPATEMDAREAIKKGIWDPKAKLREILAEAKKEGANDRDLQLMEKYIDANLGQLGRDDVSPGMRKFMSTVMAYQNMRVLMFTVFASLPDLAGPAIRSGSMKGAFKSFKDNIHNIASQEGALAEMAHALGIIQDTASEHIMTEYVDNHYMPPKLRKWNDAFFKYTGLNWYTDFTRKMALQVGIDYIEQSYNDFVSGKDAQTQARGKDMLAEMGMSPADAKKWIAAGKPTYDSQSHDMDGPERKAAEALVQFVDESIMRPNASQRPLLASHPGAMLVYHLKGYMYAVNDIMIKRMKFNWDEAQSPAQMMAAVAPAIAMMALTAIGLELRELIQYAGSNRKPPTDRMDGWEYTSELFQRSGLTGYYQIAFDFQGAEDRGMSHVAGIGGPALSQAADIISKPSTQTIPKAIPIIGQIPAAREIVRDVIR